MSRFSIGSVRGIKRKGSNSLRKRKLVDLEDKTLAEVNEHLQKVEGDMLDVCLKFKGSYDGSYGIYIRQAPDRSEETLFYYVRAEDGFWVNRNKTTLDPKERTTGIQGGTVELKEEPLELRLLLDKSLVEAYVNELKSLTTRVYPSQSNAKGISLFGAEELIVERIQVWEMSGI